MEQIALFIVIGLTPGALIAGIAVGVVLTYRGTGVINMATGSIAMMAAYAYYGLRDDGYLFVKGFGFGGPWPLIPAVIGALVVSLMIGLLLELLVLRPLRSQSPLTKLLATLGVFLTFQGFIVLTFTSDVVSPPAVLGGGERNVVEVMGVNLPADGLQLSAGVAVVAILLAVVYRFTSFGLATRAAAENDTSAALVGISANRLAMTNVLASSVLAGVVGVLVSPTTGLDPFTIANVIVPALAAALLAKFTSFPIAVGVSLALGVMQSLIKLAQAQLWFPKVDGYSIPGIADLIFVVVIVLALFLGGSALPRRESIAERRLPPVPAPVRILRPAVIAAIVAVAFFLIAGYEGRQAGINSLIGVVVALSLVLIIGFVGQASLLQVGLAGVAGFAVSKLAMAFGIGFPIAPIIGVAAAVVFGTLVAVSSLRVRGVSLAIVTMSAAVALDRFVFQNPVWGAGTQGSPVPAPEIFGVNIGNSSPLFSDGTLPAPFFGMLVALVTILATVFVARLRLSNLGHRFIAIRSNERAAAAAGIDVRSTKLLAFGLSSALAGVAGVLYAYNFGSVSAERFGLIQGLGVLAFAYIGGITTTRGAVVAGMAVIGGMFGFLVLDRLGIPSEYQVLIGGLALIATIVLKPEGIEGGPLRSVVKGKPLPLDRLWGLITRRPPTPAVRPSRVEVKEVV